MTLILFFFNDTATTEIYTLSLHDALPISPDAPFYKNNSNNLFDLPIVTHFEKDAGPFITSSIIYVKDEESKSQNSSTHRMRSEEHTSELQSRQYLVCRLLLEKKKIMSSL